MTPGTSAWEQLRRRGPGLVLRGVCMGTADVIPGVSGGTIALITGIYDELVASIAGLDAAVARQVLTGRVGDALVRANAAFLVPLLFGIGLAIVSLARLITYLLTHHPQPVWGFFTGLILSSALYVGRQIDHWRVTTLVAAACGAVAGWLVTIMVPVQTGPELYKFALAGVVAIVAMILPGVSGSFLLVLLGKYQQVFAAVHERQLSVLLWFGGGCAVGLLLFSRLLKRLLARYHGTTMAFLVGLMLGSVRKVWPFRRVLEEMDLGGKILVLRDECTWPQELSAEVWLSLVLILVGAVLVVMLERVSQRRPVAEDPAG